MNSAIEHYVKKVRRAMPIILLASVIGALVAYGITSRQGPTYEVHFSYLISLAEQRPTQDFQFDGFYALQATDLFATTVAGWLTTPEVIAQAFESQGLSRPSDNARRLQRLVAAEKTAPQLVEVTVRTKNQAEGLKLAEGLRNVMTDNIDLYHEQTVPALTFKVTTTKEWVGVQTAATGLITTATFLAILILGINAVLLVESFTVETPGRSTTQHRVI